MDIARIEKLWSETGHEPIEFARRLLAARAEPVAWSTREIELIDGMIEVQTHHAERAKIMANIHMGKQQAGWDMERVELLKKVKLYAAPPAQEAPAAPDDQEQCFYCKQWFPKPVEYHHSWDECIAPDATPETEGEKLIAFFCSKEGDELGRAGDHDNLTPAETAIRAMLHRNALRAKYDELIMAVAKKFPDETRHQTALRYILHCERASTGSGSTDAALSAQTKPGEPS